MLVAGLFMWVYQYICVNTPSAQECLTLECTMEKQKTRVFIYCTCFQCPCLNQCLHWVTKAPIDVVDECASVCWMKKAALQGQSFMHCKWQVFLCRPVARRNLELRRFSCIQSKQESKDDSRCCPTKQVSPTRAKTDQFSAATPLRWLSQLSIFFPLQVANPRSLPFDRSRKTLSCSTTLRISGLKCFSGFRIIPCTSLPAGLRGLSRTCNH